MSCTEAGKLALNFVRQENVGSSSTEPTQEVGDDIENNVAETEEEVVTETTSELEETVDKVGGQVTGLICYYTIVLVGMCKRLVVLSVCSS